MGGKGKTVIEAPKPIDAGESMRDYLDTITDPELIGKQVAAEKEFGPQFDLVSLARTQTMLEGIKDPKESEAFLNATARRIALESKKKALLDGKERLSEEDIQKQIDILFPEPEYNQRKSKDRSRAKEKYDSNRALLLKNYTESNDVNATVSEIDAELAEVTETIEFISNQPAQKGTLQMAEEAAIRVQELQETINTAARTADIEDLKALGPDLVNALRDADPTSAKLADASTELAEQAQQRAIDGVPQTEERISMGEIAQQGRDRISQLEALEAEARTPEENVELENLKGLRDRQEGMLSAAEARAADPSSVQERATMGMLAGQDAFAAMQASGLAMDPGQSQEFQNLQQLADLSGQSASLATAKSFNPSMAAGRSELGQLANLAQQQALDPTSNAERAQLGNMAQQSQEFASSLMQQAQNPALPNEERQRLIAMSQQQEQRANDIYARAGEVSAEQQGLRDSATAMRARGDDMFATAGDVSPEQQGLRNQASAMQERAQGLFAQAESAPSEQKQQLQAAAMDMMERGQGLFEQAATPSSARQAAGQLTQLSAQQARQLSADAMGPLSAQRRRMAEQAARQAGLRTGRIGDQGQLAAELLNREESRAALRAEARAAQDLAFQQASGFATDVETDAERLRKQALGFETGGFDRARGVEGDIDAQRLALLQEGRLSEGQAFDAGLGIEGQISDQEIARQGRALEASQLGMQEGRAMESQIASQELALLGEGRATTGQAFDMGRDVQSDLDDLTKQQQDQAMLAQGQAFSQTGDLITADRDMRDEAAERQEAQLSVDADLAEAARLERQAATLAEQGLMDRAALLRDEAATRRSSAATAQQNLARFDAGLREEATDALGTQAQLTSGILSTELTLAEQADAEARALRGEISSGEQTAFAREGQLAQIDESLRQSAVSEADALGTSAFNKSRAITSPSTQYLLGTSGAAGQGQAAVSQAPAISQAFPEMFNPQPGIDIDNVNATNMLNRNIAQGNIDAQDRAGTRNMIGTIIGSAVSPG